MGRVIARCASILFLFLANSSQSHVVVASSARFLCSAWLPHSRRLQADNVRAPPPLTSTERRASLSAPCLLCTITTSSPTSARPYTRLSAPEGHPEYLQASRTEEERPRRGRISSALVRLSSYGSVRFCLEFISPFKRGRIPALVILYFPSLAHPSIPLLSSLPTSHILLVMLLVQILTWAFPVPTPIPQLSCQLFGPSHQQYNWLQVFSSVNHVSIFARFKSAYIF